MDIDFANPLTVRIVEFLVEIGVSIEKGEVPDDAFLPGILVRNGGLVIDEAKLLYPGDLLHEAGHLAFAPAEIRPSINGEVMLPRVNAGVIEVQAILWSYAAALHIGIDPEIVLHEHGYYGRSPHLLANFRLGIFIGLPGLESAGMTYSHVTAPHPDKEAFPAMRKWLAD
jgi:hypothetical protein